VIRILIVGSGAREHALAWACHRSILPEKILVAPGNAGTAAIAENVAVTADDVDALVRLAGEREVDLVVIGPDAAVAAGLANACAEAAISCFGPTSQAGQVEASKRYAKQLMDEAAIPTPAWVSGGADDRESLLRFVAELSGRCVVKADGLALGKGVAVCDTEAQALAAIDACLIERRFGDAGDTVVIEERAEGREVSIFALSDGDNMRLLPAVCDYKRIGEGDTGPNTGGMGSFAPAAGLGVDVDDLVDEVGRSVMQPCIDLLRERGTPYVGVLYAGLMVDSSGYRVLEFNARFGDPEAQVLLPLLAEDAVELMGACAVGGLPPGRAAVHRGAAVGVVAASAGYPGAITTGVAIEGLEDAQGRHVHVFHAGTRMGDDGVIRTSGGRVLTVVAAGRDLRHARERAYEHLDRISFEGMQTRGDIALLEER